MRIDQLSYITKTQEQKENATSRVPFYFPFLFLKRIFIRLYAHACIRNVHYGAHYYMTLLLQGIIAKPRSDKIQVYRKEARIILISQLLGPSAMCI